MKLLVKICLSSFALVATSAWATREQSAFVKLASDVQINSTTYQIVLTRTITLSEPAVVIGVADGRYFAVDAPAGQIAVAIDGSTGNSSVAVTDWGSSSASVQHSFNALANATLTAGIHTVALVASSSSSRPGRFKVGSGSGLSVLVQPFSQVHSSFLSGESGNINVTTYNPPTVNVTEGGSTRPVVSILSQSISNPGPTATNIVSMVSGRSFNSCDSGIKNGRGDALWGIYADNTCQSTGSASWSVDDLDTTGELQGAMYAHAKYSLAVGQTRTISFVASELAFGSDQPNPHENGVCYKAGSAKLLSMVDGVVMGSASGGTNSFCSTYTWKCVATTVSWPSCLASGSNVAIGSTSVTIPSGNDGIVYFSAKTRIQADNTDSFATATLQIYVDGSPVGTIGIQQLAAGYGQSSRTLSSSYISAPGPNSTTLSVGTHTVSAVVNVSGTTLHHVSVPQDVVLTYFD